MDERTPAVRRQLTVGVCVFTALALLGAVLGVLWWALAPDRAEGVALGGGEVFTGTDEALFAGEGAFVLVTALTGLVTGYVVYMLQFLLAERRAQDLRLACLAAGFLGSAAGALLTWQVGTALDAPLHAALQEAGRGETVTVGLQLRATAFLVAWPFVFVLQYGLLDAVSLLRRDQPGLPGRPTAPSGETASDTP